MKKLIPAVILALTGSFLSALYISMVQTTNVVTNEKKLPATHPGKIGNFEAVSKQG